MNSPKIAAAAILLTACATPEEREREALLDRIERAAKLLPGAQSLNDYARFYRDEGNGQIVGVYVLPSVVEKLASEECSEITGLDTPMRDIPCVLPEVEKAKAGDRLWLEESSDLPFDIVAGCEVITLAYDVRVQHFQELGCVGHRPSSH